MSIWQEKVKIIYSYLNEIIPIGLINYHHQEQKVVRLSREDRPKMVEEIEVKDIVEIGRDFQKGKAGSVYYFESSYRLKYICIGIFEEEQYEGLMILGPYMSTHPTQVYMQNLFNQYELPVMLREHITLYYNTLPVIPISQEEAIVKMSIGLLYGISFSPQTLNLYKEMTSNEVNLHYLVEDITFKEEIIKKNYEMEEKMLRCIETGDTEGITEMFKNGEKIKMNRFPNEPIRDLKNGLIIGNTLFRRTLINIKIDPYLVHVISEKYAFKIEKYTTKNELDILVEEMAKEYCELVRKYKKKPYSDIINRAISYIELHFNQELNLKTIAETLYVHPNYLSQKFKKETCSTIPEYINDIRLNEAKYLLKNNSNMSVEDIAYMVGYNDKKYFSKVFKQKNGVSPSQYRT